MDEFFAGVGDGFDFGGELVVLVGLHDGGELGDGDVVDLADDGRGHGGIEEVIEELVGDLREFTGRVMGVFFFGEHAHGWVRFVGWEMCGLTLTGRDPICAHIC